MPVRGIIFLLASVLMFGCDMPRDPKGTLERVRGGTMRVGLIEQPPFARYEDGTPSGIEVTLVERLAEQLDAEIRWSHGGGQQLFEQLERFELDLVIGGVTQASPWSKRLGMSVAHLVEHEGRRKRAHVFAVPPGENGWLAAVDRFTYAQRDQAARLFRESQP